MNRMQRRSLAQVTLCAVDTRAPVLALQSLMKSMQQVDFGRVLLFTHDWLPRRVVPGIEIIDIGPITSGADYSQFVLRRLPAYISTSHVLVTQWDGFVVDGSAWTDAFLVHDYIGAPWPSQPVETAVGNGGFSLRSRRLLAAGMDPRIQTLHPEDTVLCVQQRDFLQRVHGVSFAPQKLAQRFAFENQTSDQATFGFHGPYNLPRFLPQAELTQWLRALPDDFFRSRDARRLARAMLARQMPDAASELLRRRQAAGRTDINTRVLSAAARVMSRVMGGVAPTPP